MLYKKIIPNKILNPYVQSIWIQDNNSDASKIEFQPTTVLPATNTEFIFHYKDPFIKIDNNNDVILPKFLFCGQRTKPVYVKAAGKTGMIIFNMSPFRVSSLINLNMSETVDKTIDFYDIFDSKILRETEEKFDEANDPLKKIKIMEDFLISILKGNREDLLVSNISDKINFNFGKIHISKIAKEYKISRRNLFRRFNNNFGVNPKQLSRIIRFQKALYLKKSGMQWADICEKCNYYDQSHFIKEMKEFSGVSPERITSLFNSTLLKKYFNASSSLSHFYNTIYL